MHPIRYRLGLRGLWSCSTSSGSGRRTRWSCRRAADPFGPDNEAVCRAAFALVDRVVVAWGNIGAYRFQHLAALAWIADAGLTPYCLGVTESGQPRHPLYCRANITPEEYVHD